MATKTHITNLQSIVHETCKIYYEQLISQSDGHPTENAYNALEQSIRQDIATHHPNSDFILVNQYIAQYFDRLKKSSNSSIPITQSQVRLGRGKNTIESKDTMTWLHETYQVIARLLSDCQKSLHQMDLAQVFAAIYVNLWIYTGVQDKQIRQQIYQHIIDKKPLLRLGNALILTVEIPSKSYGYHPRFSTSMLVDAEENADALLFVTRHIVIDDASLMWIVYINRHLQGKMPTFEQTQKAFD